MRQLTTMEWVIALTMMATIFLAIWSLVAESDCAPTCEQAGMKVWSAQPFLNRCLCNAAYPIEEDE